MSGELSGAKICGICGSDCSDQPRVQDGTGTYFHWDCYHNQEEQPAAHATPEPRFRIHEATKAVLLNLLTLGIALFVIVELMEPPLLVVMALVLAHCLQICTLMLIHEQRRTPQGARLRRWLTRPPCESFEREMSEARKNPHFDQWPFLKHFLVALFVIALVGVLISQVPELALARSDVYWAVLVGLSYYGRGLLGRELVYDPKETFAGISYYNEWGLGVLVLAVFPVAMILIVRPDFVSFLPIGPDWLIMGLLLFLQHLVSIYRGVFGPLPIGRMKYLAVAVVATAMLLWHL